MNSRCLFGCRVGKMFLWITAAVSMKGLLGDEGGGMNSGQEPASPDAFPHLKERVGELMPYLKDEFTELISIPSVSEAGYP